MRKIKTTKGKYFLCSDGDYKELRKYHWYWCSKDHNEVAYIYGRIKGKLISVHRFLMNPPQNLEIDHINGIPSDNRRENLRICTRSQNHIWKGENMKIRKMLKQAIT